MAQIETKLQKLIRTSLFLSPLQKALIQKALQNASEEDKNGLINILESEKSDISEIVENYLKKEGKDGASKLNHLITQSKGITRKSKENISHKEEKGKMEDLLNELDQV